jgi:hypothetical protein
MPINVPKFEAPQHPLGAALLPTALQAILWPWRQQVAQEAVEKRQADVEEKARVGNVQALKNLTTQNENYGTALGAVQRSPGPDLEPAFKNIENILHPGQQPGASQRQYENILATLGTPGGRTKLESSYAGETPEGETQLKTQAQGIGGVRTLPPKVGQEFAGYGDNGEPTFKTVKNVPGAITSKAPTAETSQPTAMFMRAEKASGITDPNEIWEDYKEYEKGKITARLAGIRWQAQPNGVAFDRMNGGYYDSKTKEQLSPEQVTAWQLSIKRLAPTERIKAMQQLATPLLDTIQDTRAALQKTMTGPGAGRINKILQGRIGMDDPDFATYQAWQLLSTSLGTMMHTGLRPPVEIAKMFATLTDAKQEPANIMAALDVWEKYATTLANGQNITFNIPAGGPGGKARPALPASPSPTQQPAAAVPVGAGGAVMPLPGEKYADYLKRAQAAGAQ